MQQTTPVYSKGSKIYADVNFLKVWKDNPRYIKEEDYDRLKHDLSGEQFKPLLVMEDGTVLGGNMRIRAYKDIGKNEVWVSIISLKSDGELVTAYVNNVKDRTFQSEYDAMVHYSMVDNEAYGVYDSQLVAEQLSKVALPLDQYKLQFGEPQPLNEVLKEVAPPEDEPKEPKVERITCPKCGYEFDYEL